MDWTLALFLQTYITDITISPMMYLNHHDAFGAPKKIDKK